ncbi:hypothetical protein LTR56_024597 [Elasticomyces elasticus]|nr:hypothetical protein LTR56_024597 [Elasticomyces elasticus]KAK3622425.1 hypothetical protein LTR22_024810 [Elasticomyces elasticus]KAK4905464.1 hypothetical protein LTR49_025241 [Elasticomyces elasticus]KAK5746100.1 hypothetical protein LTS12_022867 [Elasticomyces elasticus]
MPGLLDVPAELLVEVSRYTDDDTLQALRLANHELAAAVLGEYIDRFYRRRKHLFTAYGLELLANITASEHVGKHIEVITLIAPGVEHEWADQWEEREAIYEPSVAGDARCKNRNKARQLLIEARESAGRSGALTAHLSQALTNWRTAGVSPLLRLYDGLYAGEECAGQRQLLRNMNEGGALVGWEHGVVLTYGLCDDMLPGFLASIEASHFQLEALQVSAYRGLHLSGVAVPTDQEPFRNLKRLDLTIGKSPVALADTEAGVGALSKFWASAQNLQHLTIDMGHWKLLEIADLDQVADFLIKQATVFTDCKSLRSIMLNNGTSPVSGLVDFLRPFADRLERLYIHQMENLVGDDYELSLKNLEDENYQSLTYKGQEVLDWWLKDLETYKLQTKFVRNIGGLTGKSKWYMDAPKGEARMVDMRKTLEALSITEDLDYRWDKFMLAWQKTCAEREEGTEEEEATDQEETSDQEEAADQE